MSHVRQQIRAAVVTAITGAVSGAHIYGSRALPLDAPTELPALLVYARADEPEYAGMSAMGVAPIVSRRLALHIEGVVAGGDDDSLDNIAAKIEAAMFVDPSFGGKARGMYLGPQELRAEGEGESVVSVIDMQFNIIYRVAEGAPETAV